MKYILEYCIDSLEVIQLQDYPHFTLDKPLPKLHHFIASQTPIWEPCIGIRHRYSESLELMPHLRALKIVGVTKSLEKHFPKLDRVCLVLCSVEEIQSFISFLRLNPQITVLLLNIFINNYNSFPIFNADYSFEFNDLRKITLDTKCGIVSNWMNPILKVKTLKIFKITRFNRRTVNKNGVTFIKQVTQLPDLEWPVWNIFQFYNRFLETNGNSERK